MQPDEIARRLFEAAVARAAQNNLQLGHGADTDIRRLSDKAATEILRISTQTSEDSMMKNGEAVFERLVDEMMTARKELPGYEASNPGIIGEQTLWSALQKLCPIFPLC
jgi:hypothetical protein